MEVVSNLAGPLSNGRKVPSLSGEVTSRKCCPKMDPLSSSLPMSAGEISTMMNSRPSLNVRNMAAYADSGKAIAPKGIECHMSTASKSMDTGKPYLFSSGISLAIQVFDDLVIHPRDVPQAPVVTPQGCYRYSPSSIIVPHNDSSILCDPSSHSVIPIPSQDHGESFTECRLQNHTDFAGLANLRSIFWYELATSDCLAFL
jgi:hypothetical protein